MSPVRPPRRIENTSQLVPDEVLEIESDKTGEFKKSVNRVRSSYFWFYNHYNNQNEQTYGKDEIEKWDGGKYKGKLYKPIWYAIVKKLKQYNITNIERFVAAQFVFRPDKHIYPTHLCSSHAIEFYEKFRDTADRNIYETLRSSTNLFKSLFDEVKSDPNPTETVLGNLQNDLSPLFRYVIAKKEGLSNIAEAVREMAYAQFRKDPEGYLKIWGPIVSAEVLLGLLPLEERDWYV